MIVSILFEKISVEKKKEVIGNIEAKNNLKLTNLTEQTLDALGNKQPAITTEFAFSILYEPDVAQIEIKGKVMDIVNEKEKKLILEMWKKDKKIEQTYATKLMNAILVRCNIKALTLSSDVNLPPHIPFPQLAKKSQIEKKKK